MSIKRRERADRRKAIFNARCPECNAIALAPVDIKIPSALCQRCGLFIPVFKA